MERGPGEGGQDFKHAPQEEGQTKSINQMKDELNHQFSITATPAHPGSPGRSPPLSTAVGKPVQMSTYKL